MGGSDFFQVLLDVAAGIAARHRADIAAVAIQYVLNQPGIAAAVVGVRHGKYLPPHLAAGLLVLDDAERRAIAEILAQRWPL